MVDLITINTKVGLGKLKYIELLEEHRQSTLSMTNVTCSGCVDDLDCLRMTIQSLEYDIQADVNNDLTQTVYALLLTLIGGYAGAYVVDPSVSGSSGSPIIISGIQGPQGVQGIQGVQGLQGEQGIQGIQGEQGIQGIQGEQGIQGADGEIIIAGEIANLIGGLVNPTPEDGEDGYYFLNTVTRELFGPKAGGVWPSIGVQLNGSQGIQGIQGVQGEQGETGATGAQGEQGEQGVQGLQGIQGTQGVQGIQGEAGADGLSAYEIAVDNGFVGTESEWLESLQGADGTGGDFEELNRDTAFTVVNEADEVMGRLKSNGIDTLSLNSPTDAEYILMQEEDYTPIVATPAELDITYTITNSESLNLTVTFKSGSGTELDSATTGTGTVGDPDDKPLSGELLGVTVSTDGSWTGPVKVVFNIRKDGVLFDSFSAIYETALTGVIETKYFSPTEFNDWEVEVVIETTVVDEVDEVDNPPVIVVSKSLVGVSDTITDGEASVKLLGEGSYDPDGQAVTYRWIFNDPDVLITDI